MEEKEVFELDFKGRKIVVEVGELAKQANAACLIRYEDTAVLSATVMSNNATTADFFPLTINYQEKFYSVGKIPGGFIKREGRPTEQAILAARLIDRPIRPLFADGFRNEVQVINTVLSVDQDCSPEMTALFGNISVALFELDDILFQIENNFRQNIENILTNIQENINNLNIDENKNEINFKNMFRNRSIN